MRNDDDSLADDQEYGEFLRRKVEIALAQIEAGHYRSNDLVEADFAERRASLRSENGTSTNPRAD